MTRICFQCTIEEPRLTGEVIGKAILRVLKNAGMNLEAAIGQSYDGATVVHASKLPVVRNMISRVKKVTTFLSKSNKKKAILAKAADISKAQGQSGLQSLCETRWVERVTTLERFVTNYVVIVRALMAISRWRDTDANQKAKSLLNGITNSTFVVTLFSCVAVLNNIDNLSKNLQKKNTSLREAMLHVQDIIATLENDRKLSEIRFTTLMKWINDTVACLKLEITPPRVCSRSCYRSNPDVSSGFDYFRVAVYIPFIDTILAQLKFRFNDKSKIAGIFDILLPSSCHKYGESVDEFQTLWKTYSETLTANNVRCADVMKAVAEYRQWVCKWKREFDDKSPTDHIATVKHCDCSLYPTIQALLQIASILPVSTATVERSFSTLRRLKTYLRNRTSQERLNGLALMNIYNTVAIDTDRIIDRFSKTQSRRLVLI
ncbi:52 kDa repressor of the inhibitor of the protein kinase-like [Anneissia japonica]|uniref:52 kDa repressor of the inhibitor of the protein kinase-like n=1 Tax=Anneissia japonica TaxID=1529436 RepID=UPI0014259C94|nr:52 kDa repressor of the inhibitor of the protein kinase-like [Anneissia japonica]